MKTRKIALLLSILLPVVLSAAVAAAADFEWLKELSVRAKADPEGFAAQVAARFEVGKAKVQAVIGKVDDPADAYMAYRLSEMSGKPLDEVVDRYQEGKKKGWGALAQSLGIKPGSPEFHALKKDHDLEAKREKGEEETKGKGEGKGKNKGKE